MLDPMKPAPPVTTMILDMAPLIGAPLAPLQQRTPMR
jgi:hypothetical protein